MDKKVIGLIAKAVICTTVASIYAGASLFFRDSFYFGTELAGLKVGGYTADAVQYAISHKGEEYEISLYGKGVDKQKLYGKDFGLQYSTDEDLHQLKREQNAWVWPLALFKDNKLEIEEQVSYDEKALQKAIETLPYFDASKVIEPVNAQVTFNGEAYEITPEVEGNKLNEEAVKETVINAFHNNERVISLEDSNCYEKPTLTQDSKELMDAKDLMNKYVNTKVTYLFGSQQEVVTPQIISEWLEVNDESQVNINEKKVRGYIKELDNKYSTLGKTRTFKTSYGAMATVSGGDYGWQISVSKESEALIEAIKNGEEINREPISTINSQSYTETDIGDSYVEISLTKQYLWYYKDGKLVTKGDVVTGDQSRNRITPPGVYKLDYKQRNATLNGPNYSTPVSFWMPFNGDIGIHDAVWRSQFGGSIYINNGSHGCVNAPYNMAKAIFSSIDESVPIICYY